MTIRALADISDFDSRLEPPARSHISACDVCKREWRDAVLAECRNCRAALCPDCTTFVEIWHRIGLARKRKIHEPICKDCAESYI